MSSWKTDKYYEPDFKVIWTERNMVSEKLKYGGCPDLLVRKYNKETDKHEMIMIDFKTGKGIYPDKAMIVRIPKDNQKIEVKTFSSSQLKLGFKQFDLLRKAHINNFKLKKIFEKRKRKK